MRMLKRRTPECLSTCLTLFSTDVSMFACSSYEMLRITSILYFDIVWWFIIAVDYKQQLFFYKMQDQAAVFCKLLILYQAHFSCALYIDSFKPFEGIYWENSHFSCMKCNYWLHIDNLIPFVCFTVPILDREIEALYGTINW